MLDVESRGTPTNSGSNSGLVPLPKRVAVSSDGAPAITDPGRTVGELIQRAAHLVATLDHDVEGLKSDQEEERQRIERTWEQRQTRAEQAIEQLAVLRGAAERLAERKARPDLLRAGLAKTEIASFPYSDLTPFEELVEAVDSEVKMAKGITGLIRLEGIGELVSAATRSVKRLLAEADSTKTALLAQTKDDLTAERKEARASFEIGLQVLRRDLELLNAALPLSARSWDDPGWENREPIDPQRCLIRLGSYVHPRLRNTPIPAVVELPGGPGFRFDPNARREPVDACLRSVILRGLAATPTGGLHVTVIDPRCSGDALRSVLYPLQQVPGGGAFVHTATTEAAISEALDSLLTQVDRIDAQVLGSRFESLTECNSSAGEVVEPWHLLLVLDHPGGLTDRATQVLHKLVTRGPRAGLTTIVVADSAPPPAFGDGGRQRQREPLPALETVTFADGDFAVDRGPAGRWTVELDDAPSDSEATEIIRLATTGFGRTTAARPDTFERLLKLLQPDSVGHTQPRIDRGVERDDPSTWWSASAAEGIGLPVGRRSGLDALSLEFNDDDRGAAIISGHDAIATDALVALLIDDIAVLYPPDQVQTILVAVRGRSCFDACIEAQLPHARLIGVDAEHEFSVAVLEGLAAELGRRLGSAGPDGAPTQLPRLVVVITGFTELLEGNDRLAVRAVELFDQLLNRSHRSGLHLVLADTDIDETLLSAHPALRRCRSRIDVGPREGPPVDSGAAGTEATLTTPIGTTTFRPTPFNLGEHEKVMWEARAKAHEQGVPSPPQIYDGCTPARLDRSGVERLAMYADRRPQRLKPRFWLGDPTSMGGPVEVLLRRTDGANLLVVTNDEFGGRGIMLGAITTAVLNHGDSMRIVVADFLPTETGFGEAVHVLERSGAITVARRRQFDKALHEVQRTVNDRQNAGTFNEAPMLLVLAGLGRARDLDIDPDDPEAVERHQALESIIREGPEVGVHTAAWCEAPAALSRRLSRAELKEFSLRVVGPLDADIGRGITGSDAPAALAAHQALLFDDDAGRATRFRPYRPPSPQWLGALVARLG